MQSKGYNYFKYKMYCPMTKENIDFTFVVSLCISLIYFTSELESLFIDFSEVIVVGSVLVFLIWPLSHIWEQSNVAHFGWRKKEHSTYNCKHGTNSYMWLLSLAKVTLEEYPFFIPLYNILTLNSNVINSNIKEAKWNFK